MPANIRIEYRKRIQRLPVRIRPVAEDPVVLVLRARPVRPRARKISARLSSAFGCVPGSARRRPIRALIALSVLGLIEVAQVGVQPSEAIQQPMMDRLVPDTLRQRQPFVERGQRLVVVALAGERQAAQEATEEQRKEQAALARERLSLRSAAARPRRNRRSNFAAARPPTTTATD